MLLQDSLRTVSHSISCPTHLGSCQAKLLRDLQFLGIGYHVYSVSCEFLTGIISAIQGWGPMKSKPPTHMYSPVTPVNVVMQYRQTEHAEFFSRTCSSTRREAAQQQLSWAELDRRERAHPKEPRCLRHLRHRTDLHCCCHRSYDPSCPNCWNKKRYYIAFGGYISKNFAVTKPS